MEKQYSAASITLAVFTVSAGQETVAHVIAACVQTPSAEFTGEFRDYLSVNKRPQFSQNVKSASGCVAVVDFDQDREQAAQTAEVLLRAFPGRIAVVAVSGSNGADILLSAMRAGCNEYLKRPFDANQFLEILARQQARFADLTGEAAQHAGKLISFFGVKGGAGTTTLAVHLAIFLVLVHRKKTLLIDHHHQLGHVCLYLGLSGSQYHFDELIRNVDRLDANLFAGFLTRHSSGLDVLSSPDTCASRYKCAPGETERVLDFLRGQYDYVLVDSSLEYEDVNSAIVDHSDEVYLVSTADVAALRDLSRHIENFRLNEATSSKVRIAINRSSSNDAVSSQQIESAVRFPVSVAIPNHYAQLVRAINAGEPILPRRRSDFTAQLSKWANDTIRKDAGVEAEIKAKKRFGFRK